MATWSSLTADADLMKAGNESILIDNSTGQIFNDSDLLSLNKTGAKIIMKRDLEEALRIDQEDTTILDSVVDLNETNLKTALTYLQLKLIFANMDFGFEGLSYRKYLEYDKQYKDLKAKFPYLMVRQLNVSYNTTGNFKIG